MAETEGVTRRFDPRFSPAFQPGYDPRVHREEPPSAPLREEPRADWTEPRRPVAEPRGSAGDPRDEFSIFAVPEDLAEEPGDAVLEDVEPQPWWRRVNPWFLVLWVLGVVFILVGASIMSFVFDWANSPQRQAEFGFATSILMQSTLWGAPMLIVLGLATLTSTVVILAARWSRPS